MSFYQGSWKGALRNSFKIFRKGCKPSGDEEATVEPLTKWRKIENEDTIDIMQEEYDDTMQQLKEEYKKKLKKGETESK